MQTVFHLRFSGNLEEAIGKVKATESMLKRPLRFTYGTSSFNSLATPTAKLYEQTRQKLVLAFYNQRVLDMTLIPEILDGNVVLLARLRLEKDGFLLDLNSIGVRLCKFALFNDPDVDRKCFEVSITKMDLRGLQPLNEVKRFEWSNRSPQDIFAMNQTSELQLIRLALF